MTTFWVLVANSSFAKIYEVTGMGKDVKMLEHISFLDGRKKSGEVNTDKPGRAFDRVGMGRHAVGTTVDVHAHEMKIFTHQLTEILNKGKLENKYDQVALIAPPQFLGELRHTLNEAVKKSILKEVPKDLPDTLSEQELIQHMCKYLDLWNHH